MSEIKVMMGAGRGIGLEMAKRQAEAGGPVVAVCRTLTDELRALGEAHENIQIEAGIDVTDKAALEGLVNKLQAAGHSVGMLIQCAGMFEYDALDRLENLDSIRRHLECNTLAPLQVVLTFLPLLGEGSKIGIVTSRMGSIGDNTSGSYYGYRISKAAVNMAGVTLARDLADRGIAVALLHPGYVRTKMTNFQGDIGPDEAAAGLLARMDALNAANSGSFWHAKGQPLPW